MRDKESDRYNNRVMPHEFACFRQALLVSNIDHASDVARFVRFLVSTSGLMGLFVNSHATGRDGDDDWAQGSGGDSGEEKGVDLDVPGPMKINLNRAYNNVGYAWLTFRGRLEVRVSVMIN